MMREIGSEFWSIPVLDKKNNFFPDNAVWFLSGRSALRAIIQDIKKKGDIHTAALPSWCCDSMIYPFLIEGLKVSFYPVFADYEVKREIISQNDVTLIMDYFGYQSDQEIYDSIIIRDLTHAVFNNNYQNADYYYGSLRKWCGFLTGGFAFGIKEPDIVNNDYVSLRKEAMKKKEDYITGLTDSKEYIDIFAKAEKILDSCEIAQAAQSDIENVSKLDVDFIVKRRKENASILLEQLSNLAIFKEIKENDCPLFVPIRLHDRDKLKNYLIQKQIYCPVHWPLTEYHDISDNDKKIYNEELSLVCDQRYSCDDMYRLAEEVKRGLKTC